MVLGGHTEAATTRRQNDWPAAFLGDRGKDPFLVFLSAMSPEAREAD
jgi:hypothetical protein